MFFLIYITVTFGLSSDIVDRRYVCVLLTAENVGTFWSCGSNVQCSEATVRAFECLEKLKRSFQCCIASIAVCGKSFACSPALEQDIAFISSAFSYADAAASLL